MAAKRRRNPSRSLFNPNDLPHELLDGADVESELKTAIDNINPTEVIHKWITHRKPTMTQSHDCVDVLADVSAEQDKVGKQELYLGGKLALCGYAMPYFMSEISNHFHMKNHKFYDHLESFVAESTFLAYQDMDDIVEGKKDKEILPDDAQVGGFYIRTPIQMWNQQKKRVYRVPSWENRKNLLKYFVVGNVNVYVLRQNLEDGYECYICFRGTSNEFNGIPQYGEKMKNTQIYRLPQYSPLENKFYTEGSNGIPLFYYYYTDMIVNVYPHIMQCLEWMNAMDDHCKRIVVAGHSMGAALTTTYCYLLYHKNREMWNKTFFRAYASPLCCNNAAVLQMEQAIIDSMQVNKFIETVNTDDFVNIQYMLGGRHGLRKSIAKGTSSVASWLLNHFDHDGNKNNEKNNKNQPEGKKISMVSRMLHIIQIYPEIALSAFMRGAVEGQVEAISSNKKSGFRFGQRKEEVKFWGTTELKKTYNQTLRLFFCHRRIDWKNEYVGKSHSNYVDLNINVLWAPIRMYEDHLYKFYASHTLRKNNKLRIIPLFPQYEVKDALQLVKAYKPASYKPNILSLKQSLKKRNKPLKKTKQRRNKKKYQLKKRGV